jgi:hypothetical protein
MQLVSAKRICRDPVQFSAGWFILWGANIVEKALLKKISAPFFNFDDPIPG